MTKQKKIGTVPDVMAKKRSRGHPIHNSKFFNKSSTFFQLKRGWIGEDGVHLHKSNAVHYWEENFQDIERQIKVKSKTQLSKSNPLLSN